MSIQEKGISNYYRIEAEDAFKMYDEKKEDVFFIDVRKPDEWFETGVVPGAIKITLEDFSIDKISTLKKESHYIVMCSYGSRSSIACNLMAENGFNNVYSLQGGMLEWNTSNYPLDFD